MINRLAIIALVGATILWMHIGCTSYRREVARMERDHIAAIEAARDAAQANKDGGSTHVDETGFVIIKEEAQ